MVCGRRVTVRESPEFYAQDVGVVLEGAVVRVFEEKEVQYACLAQHYSSREGMTLVCGLRGCERQSCVAWFPF